MSETDLEPIRRRLAAAAEAALQRDATDRAGNGVGPTTLDERNRLAVEAAQGSLAVIDRERLGQGLRSVDRPTAERLLASVAGLTVGLGPIQSILDDESVEEVLGRWDHLVVHRAGRRPETITGSGTPWVDEEDLVGWLTFVARTHGRTERAFNPGSPLLVVRLGPGLRLAAQREVGESVTFALRRNVLSRVDLDRLAGRTMFHPLVADLLRAAMSAEGCRLVLSGATGSGKTTLARACLAELSPEEHVIIMEDTAEIDLFDPVRHPNVETWEVREPNVEGRGGVGLDDLVRHSLRHRPDWCVVGEVRDGAAATPMLAAMSAGMSSLTTVHARSAVGALAKLQLYLAAGPERLPADVAQLQLSTAVDLVVQIRREAATGRRYVSEIVQVVGFDGDRCLTSSIYGEASGRAVVANGFDDDFAERLVAAGFDPTRLSRWGAAA